MRGYYSSLCTDTFLTKLKSFLESSSEDDGETEEVQESQTKMSLAELEEFMKSCKDPFESPQKSLTPEQHTSFTTNVSTKVPAQTTGESLLTNNLISAYTLGVPGSTSIPLNFGLSLMQPPGVQG